MVLRYFIKLRVQWFMIVYLIVSEEQNIVQIIRKDNLNKPTFAHLSINSIRNRFDSLADIRKINIDIKIISETKADNVFPDGQFFLNDFAAPFCLDQNRSGGGIMLFIRKDNLAKVVSTDDRPNESFHEELNIRKIKWLLNCSCNPKYCSIESYLVSLSKSIDSQSSKCDYFIFLNDFNSSMEDCPIWGNLLITKSYKRVNMFKNQHF